MSARSDAPGREAAAETASAIDEAVQAALATVNDPEIRRPITELGMVRSAVVGADGSVRVELLLTIAGCPLKDKLRTDITAAVGAVPGVTGVEVEFGVMSPEQRQELQARLRGGTATAEPVIPFAQPGSRTRVYAVASGKGGVGKSSVTVNLAAALADRGLSVGVVDADGSVRVELLLTIAGCPLKDKLRADITAAVGAVPGVTGVEVDFGVMSPEQRQALQAQLRGGTATTEPVIPFAQPGSRTRVYAVASGKGGVGKSSVTVNLAAALAARGLSVGVVDADIYGHSVPRMLGANGRPTRVEDMIMPPQAHGVKVISIGMFTADNAAVV
ncbi:MAG TPA: P-loop NTPase, partial [Micromonosporaceae bacterium]|nr:P-loop NTPase [Micromonosporaceae bacterium]